MGKSSPTRMQMKDVRYGAILAVLRDMRIDYNYVNAHHVYEKFPDVPYKIIRNKLSRLIDKRILEGCVCGCSTALHAGYYQTLHEVVEFYDGATDTWTDKLLPINSRKP